MELELAERRIQAEKHQALIEYLKFMTTLSTGSIVLLTSFLERIEAQSGPAGSVKIAFVAFTTCIFACVAAYSILAMNFGHRFSDREANLPALAIIMAWISFIVAIIALTVFGLGSL